MTDKIKMKLINRQKIYTMRFLHREIPEQAVYKSVLKRDGCIYGKKMEIVVRCSNNLPGLQRG